jgi:hypothetical protein
MSTLHVAWVFISSPAFGNAPGTVQNILSAEEVATSSTSAQSGAAPTGATHARVASVDADHYVCMPAASPTAAASNSVYVPSGGTELLPVSPGQKIAAKTLA